MSADYAVLAPIYDELGLAAYAARLAPRLLDYAQNHDWLGRKILILGCGTGAEIEYLAEYKFYTLTGVDISAEMLSVARTRIAERYSDAHVEWLREDMRELSAAPNSIDMALALNVMNELNSLRDLETAFASIFRILDAGKLLIFDMITLQGQAEEGERGDFIVLDKPDRLTVFASSQYDYERQIASRRYIIFQRSDMGWNRSEARLVLRSFPVQAVASLLGRVGFKLSAILQPDLNQYEPGVSSAPRVIFVAEKP